MTRALACLAAILIAGCSEEPVVQPMPRAFVDTSWPQRVEGVAMGQVTAVDVDEQNRVFVLQRGDRAWAEPFPTEPIAQDTVLVFDGQSGALLDRWGAGQFVMPHGLSVDEEGKVWITDAAREQVYRYSPDGKLELTLGTRGVTGDDASHFGRPTDVLVYGDRVLVADGYRNGRVAIFDRNGSFIGQFGSEGSGKGQFAVPHSIALNGQAILVADRENARVEVFDLDGGFVKAVPMPDGGRPYAVKRVGGGMLATLEGRDGQDREGAVLRIWSKDWKLDRTLDASPMSGPSRGHDFAVGPGGAIYMADVEAGRVAKIDLSMEGP